MSSARKVEFWARCRFYEPFTLGGDLWQWVKYKLEGYEHVAAGYKVYVVEFDGEAHVHEASTGGYMCKDKTRKKALQKARRLIKITPNFSTQIAAHQQLGNLREVETEEAIRRLSNGENKGEAA